MVINSCLYRPLRARRDLGDNVLGFWLTGGKQRPLLADKANRAANPALIGWSAFPANPRAGKRSPTGFQGRLDRSGMTAPQVHVTPCRCFYRQSLASGAQPVGESGMRRRLRRGSGNVGACLDKRNSVQGGDCLFEQFHPFAANRTKEIGDSG